ncbi:MAG TPA: AI-2E family transporter [Chthoniobacterales bacterium]
MERPNISGASFRTAFVLLLVVAVSALFFAVTWPFLKPLLLGALLAGLFHPLYRWLARIFRGRTGLAAAITLLILFVIVIGPLSAFATLVVSQAVNISQQALPWLQAHFSAGSTFNAHDWLVQRFPLLAPYVPEQAKILETVGNAAQSAGGFLVGLASRVPAGTAGFIIDVFVTCYAMVYFLRDGHRVLAKIFYYTPLNNEDESRVLQLMRSITRATIKGTIVIGAIQGALGGIAFFFCGLEGAAFWGTMMAILSVVPGIGSAIVWVPAVIYLFVTGQGFKAVMLLLWCSVVVGTVDNLLRPMLVGKDTQMPDLLILVGTLGGLFLFGPIGFIVGPIVCGLFLTVWEIYGTTFRDVLPPVTGFAAEKTNPSSP